jgi:NAD(P)-dependent dehydrogenase (short-subunit alcohol dehydrogenase family)
MTFGFESTTDEVLEGVDLSGMWTLITGASTGLGQETARAMASHGANVVLGVRDLDKGERAAEAIMADAPGVEVALEEVDLASLDSVRAFTDRVSDTYDHFDRIIANAGVMMCPEGRTADGFETQIGTNHIGHFVLVNRLVPMVSSPGRIVCLSSAGHRMGDVDLDDPNFDQTPYDPITAYGRSKTANVLFAVELDRRLRDRDVRVCAVHPGAILTELGRHLTDDVMNDMTARRGKRKMEFKTVEQGAATSVWAACTANADAVGGHYCEDCSVSGVITDHEQPVGVMPYAVDPEHARALWDATEVWAGESFPSG